MPTTRTVTPEDRLRQLAARGQQCDGRNRQCLQTAVVTFHLVAVDPATKEPAEGAEPLLRRSCSLHRRSFAERADWLVIDSEAIASRGARPQDQERAIALTTFKRLLRGRRFTAGTGAMRHTIVQVKFVAPDNYRLTDETGAQHLLTEVKLLPDETTTAVTFSG